MRHWIRTLTLGAAVSFSMGSALASAPDHHLEVVVGSARSGKAAVVEVKIEPTPGWRWNKDYPAKLTLQAEGLESQTLHQLKGGFKRDGDKASAQFSLSAREAGTKKATLTGKIGICNDRVCRIKDVNEAFDVRFLP